MANQTTFEKLPIGTYNGVVYDAEIKDPSNARQINRPVPEGQPEGSLGKMWVNDKGEEKFQNLNIQLKVTDGEHENRRAFRMFNLGPKSQGFLIDFLTKIGHTEFLAYKAAWEQWDKGGRQGEEPQFELDHTSLPGYHCRFVIKHEADKRQGHEGETQERVSDILPPAAADEGSTPGGPWMMGPAL
jgi:hypothetical protein